MATTQSVQRADVRVEQKLVAPGVTPITPTLRPVAIGPCYQVVDGLENGAPRSEAQTGSYENVRRTINKYDFPDPRSNNAYLDFLDDETRLFMQVGSSVREMKRDERWLAGNYTTAATSVRAVGSSARSKSISISGGVPLPTFTQAPDSAELTGSVDISAGAAVDGLVLKFRADWQAWVTVTFSGVNPIAKSAIVDAVNAAWVAAGFTGVIATAPGNFLVLTSQAEGEESVLEVDDAASTAKTLLGFGSGNQLDYGQAYQPQPGDEFYADGVLLGEIVTVDSDTQVTLDTEHIVYTGTTPGELNATRWYIRAKNLVTPKAATRPTPELLVHPTATGASITGTEDLTAGGAVDGLTFIFKIDEDSAWTTVTFSGTNPIALSAIVTAINMAYGKVVASDASNFLKLASTTTGNTSRVFIGAGTANSILGFVNTDSREGVSIGDLELAGAFLRSATTSSVLSSVTASVYVQYRALRLDVTPKGADPKLVEGSSEDLDALRTNVGPFSTQNPLGLAMYLMTVSAPGMTIYGAGVDSADSDAEGDRSAYLRTLNWSKSQRGYAIATMTEQEEVTSDLYLHVEDQSTKENSNWRVGYASRAMPDRNSTTVVESGTNGNATGTGTMQLESDVESLLRDAGIADPTSMSVSDGVYIMFVDDEKRYNLASANGFVISDNITFAVGENTDSFYSTTQIPSTYLSKSWSLFVRGTVIATVGGLKDYSTIADAHQLLSNNVKTRRMRMVLPGECSLVDGEDQTVRVKGYYLAAMIAADVCYRGPSQGATNRNVQGVDQLFGSNDVFSPEQQKVIGYNNYLLVQEPVGSGNPITRWHQATTDPTSDDTREESITTQLDAGSIVLRDGMRSFIGKTNINAPNFDDLFMQAYNGLIEQIKAQNIWLGAELIEFSRAPNSKTKLYMKVRPVVAYPLNNADIELYL